MLGTSLFGLLFPTRRAQAPLAASVLIAAITLVTGRAFPQASASEFGFEDYLLVPLRIHLLSAQANPQIETTLKKADVARILEKVNRVWSQAGVHFFLESLVEEEAANQHAYPDSEAQHDVEDKWVLELRPKGSMRHGLFHIYYVKHLRNNGVYFPEAIFVKDTASLRAVEGGIDEPIPRVTSHELGHALALVHRQSNTNLMASGTTGTSLTAAEITRARSAAANLSWIEPAPVVMESANDLYWANRPKEAAALYARIATIRLESEAVALARRRAAR
ncbi:MAG: Matrixin [Verrucomicrobiota bacterium]